MSAFEVAFIAAEKGLLGIGNTSQDELVFDCINKALSASGNTLSTKAEIKDVLDVVNIYDLCLALEGDLKTKAVRYARDVEKLSDEEIGL